MSLTEHWDRQYRGRRPIWDSDRPTAELVRVVGEDKQGDGKEYLAWSCLLRRRPPV
jgi:hypothetical protein